MSQDIKNVIVIGASGNVGQLIVSSLLTSNFIVSALTRSTSTTTFPPHVSVHKTDYSHSSLLAAFKGKDAIVSAIATYSTTQQKAIIDAAVEAGVKRFLPSEYGVDTSRPEIYDFLPPAIMKQEVVEYLKTKEADGLSWTAICVGAWFDWPLELGIMSFNPHSQSATIYDSGNQPYEATNVAQVSHAVTATLVHANKTANQYVYINSFTLTQNKLLAALERASGTKWDVTHSTAKEFGESSLTKLKESESQSPVRMSPVGDYPDGAPQLITAVIYGYRPDGVVSLNDFEGKAKVWNQKLGLKEEDLEDTVRGVLEKIKVAKVGTKE